MNAKKLPAGPTALILAGGNSSRFGSDKALAEICGEPLISFIISRLSPLFTRIIISTNNPGAYERFGRQLCTDILPISGPLAGLHAGLTAADSDWVFLTACDMPFVSAQLVRTLQKKSETGTAMAVVPSLRGFIEPMPGFYSTSLVKMIEQTSAETDSGLFSFLKKTGPAIVEFDDERSFYNINRPADLENLSLRD